MNYNIYPNTKSNAAIHAQSNAIEKKNCCHKSLEKNKAYSVQNRFLGAITESISVLQLKLQNPDSKGSQLKFQILADNKKISV